MLKRMVVTGLVLGLWVSVAWAAGVGGTVVAVQKNKLRLVTSSAPEAWVKKGVTVSILGGKGAIVEVKADTISITTPKAQTLKVGDAVKFEKVRSTAGGC